MFLLRVVFFFIVFITTPIHLYPQDKNKLQDLEGIDLNTVSGAVEEINKALGEGEDSNVSTTNNDRSLDIASLLENSESFNDFKIKIENLNKEKKDKYGRELNALKIKFSTALNITFKIIDDVKKLEVLYGTLEIYSDFADNANPTKYQAFNSNLNLLKEGSFKSGIKLPDIEISNPYVSIAYSLIGGIFSKKEERQKAIQEMTCVIEYTMEFKSDLRSIDTSIGYLSESSKTNKNNGVKIFNKLLKQIEYPGNYEKYRKDSEYSADPLISYKDDYFNQFIDGEPNNYLLDRNVKIRELKLSIQALDKFIESYESLLYNGLSYYESFLKIVKKYIDSDSIKYPCISNSDKSNFQDMYDQLEQIRDQYKDAYQSVVTTGDKLSLIFGVR